MKTALKVLAVAGVMLALNSGSVAQTPPYFAPELRTNRVKSADTRDLSGPVVVEDSTRFFFHIEIQGADEPWVPQPNRVRVYYDTADHHLKALFPWGGPPRILDSIALAPPADTALWAYFADSAGKVEWANVLNAPAIGDSVRAAWKADTAGKADTARAAGAAPWTGITGKPATFPPSSHAHLVVDITDFPDSIRAAYIADTAKVAGAVAWGGITGEPTFLVPGDSTIFRANSDYKYQAKGTYLIPSDSSEMRDASDALYQPLGSYQPAGTYLTPPDSTEFRANSEFKYQPKDADLTTFAATNPSANVFSFLAAADYAAMRTLLALVIGTNVQAYDADLTTYAGITPSANVQTLLGSADYAAFRTNLSLVPGTNVQAYDADLATIAGLTPTTDNFLIAVSSAWASRTPAQARTTLSLPIFDLTDPGATSIFPKWDDTENEVDWESAATHRTSLGAQASDADLTTLAGLTAITGNSIRGVAGAWASVADKDTIVKAFGFYNVSAADSAYLLMVPVGAGTWTVRDARAIRVGGTAATINVRNKTDGVALFDNYAVTTSMAQVDASINNATLSASDVLMVELISITGTVQELFVELIIEVPD